MNFEVEQTSSRQRLRPVRPVPLWPMCFLIAAVGAVITFIQPATGRAEMLRPHTSTYNFSYAADLPENPVYEKSALETGDPLFRSVVDAVTVGLDFRAGDNGFTKGTLATRVILVSSAGWSRTIVPISETPIDGSVASASIPLNFAEIWQLATQINTRTGVDGDLTVTVEAAAAADVPADGGEVWKSLTTGKLQFDLDVSVVRMLSTNGAVESNEMLNSLSPVAAASDASTEEGPIAATVGMQVVTEMMDTTVSVPREYSLGAVNMSVADARTVLSLLAVIFGLFTLVNVAIYFVASRRGEYALIDLRHGGLVRELTHMPAGASAKAVWVGSFDTLVRAARNAECEILCHVNTDGHTYYVFDGPTLYAYMAAPMQRIPRISYRPVASRPRTAFVAASGAMAVALTTVLSVSAANVEAPGTNVDQVDVPVTTTTTP